MSEDDNLSDKDDRLIQRYDTILKESALLTTFSGILFGFLLRISGMGLSGIVFLASFVAWQPSYFE